MKKVLMHKDTPVASFNIAKNGRINGVQITNDELFPHVNDSDINAIRRWMITRKTAMNRPDLAPIIQFYGKDSFTSDTLRSMQDCYWLKDESSNLSWEDISAFRLDDLDEDGVFLSIAKPKDFERFTENSPNLTLSGKSQLFWYYDDDKLGIINSNSQADMQVYKIAQANNIDIFKERKYLIISGNIYTYVQTETSEEIERIPFDQLYLSVEDPTRSKSENLKECCIKYHIPGWKSFIQKLIAFNKVAPDRKIELLDIGVLRKADTLEYLGFDKI